MPFLSPNQQCQSTEEKMTVMERRVILGINKCVVVTLCLSQVAQHYILCIQTFVKSLGWHVLAYNNHIGVGDLEPVGNALGAIIVSPFHDKYVHFSVNFNSTIHCTLCWNSVYIIFFTKIAPTGHAPKSIPLKNFDIFFKNYRDREVFYALDTQSNYL